MDAREGDPCQIEGCKGRVVIEEVEGCSCHINPPCSRCVDAGLVCNECYEEYEWELD